MNTGRIIRVLIAEDSSTSRLLLGEILRSDGRFEVVGEAVNGLEAVDKTGLLKPDVILMDIHMPGIDGVKATRRIMESFPVPIVIVTGSALFNDVSITLEALNAGALAVLRKPSGPGSPGFLEESIRIVSTIKAMAGLKLVRRKPRQEEKRIEELEKPEITPRPVRILVVGASTGGPAVLRQILSSLPASFPVPILVVQHISDGFTAGFAEWLGDSSSLIVKIAEDGELLVPGTVYIAPERRHLGVYNSRISISKAPPVGGFQPSVSYMFESVVAGFGSEVLAIIASGMGDDGVEGLRRIKERGGLVWAQDENSCAVFGMPARSIEAGLVNAVLSPDEMVAGALKVVGI